MTSRIKELTKGELQIMQILWDIEKGVINDVLDRMEVPKPAYTTVSTIVRILEKKGFVGHQSYGKTHEYYPLIGRKEYTGNYMNSVLTNFFDDSVSQLVSFFAEREKISVREMNEIMTVLRETKPKDGGKGE